VTGPSDKRVLAYPAGLTAWGVAGADYRRLLPVADLPPGAMRRVTVG
jgi:hypothetical protein